MIFHMEGYLNNNNYLIHLCILYQVKNNQCKHMNLELF